MLEGLPYFLFAEKMPRCCAPCPNAPRAELRRLGLTAILARPADDLPVRS
jgi:uncharacterized protein YjeT (DUF2065 family)